MTLDEAALFAVANDLVRTVNGVLRRTNRPIGCTVMPLPSDTPSSQAFLVTIAPPDLRPKALAAMFERLAAEANGVAMRMGMRATVAETRKSGCQIAFRGSASRAGTTSAATLASTDAAGQSERDRAHVEWLSERRSAIAAGWAEQIVDADHQVSSPPSRRSCCGRAD